MWEISNYDQIITFILSLCLGLIFCIFYDIIRAVRRVCLNSALAVNISDVLIWIIYAFITFIFLISRTNGEIRGYVICGELLGFMLFRITFSKYLFKVMSFVFIKISALIQKISRQFYIFSIKMERHILKTAKYVPKILKSVKKFLKNTGKLLYNNRKIEDAERSLNETKTEA